MSVSKNNTILYLDINLHWFLSSDLKTSQWAANYLTAASVSCMNVYYGLDSYLCYSSNNKRSLSKQHQHKRSAPTLYGKITNRIYVYCINIGGKWKCNFVCVNIQNFTLNKLTIQLNIWRNYHTPSDQKMPLHFLKLILLVLVQ